MRHGASLRIALDRDPHSIADSAVRMAVFCRTHKCDEEVVFRIQTGSAELFNNIYEHGTAQPHAPRSPWVTVHLRVFPRQVSLVVLEPPGPAIDPGPGHLPAWTLEAGRGLFILTQWFPVYRRRRWHGRTCWQLSLPR